MKLSPLRKGRITASRVGAILGLNPYSNRDDVIDEMVRESLGYPPVFTGNEATEYGQKFEPECLDRYQQAKAVSVYGGGICVVHPFHDFLAATPDGLVGDDGIVECKAPYRGNYKHFRDKPYYEAQMRLQLECLQRQWCDFVVMDRSGQIHISRMVTDPDWIVFHLPSFRKFMADFSWALECQKPIRFGGAQ